MRVTGSVPPPAVGGLCQPEAGAPSLRAADRPE